MQRFCLIAAAALIAAWALPAHAAQTEAMDQAQQLRQKKDKESDDAYKAMKKNTDQSTKPVKTDPWGTVRPPSPNTKSK